MLWRQMLDICHFYDTDACPNICAGVLSLMQSNSTKACQLWDPHTFPFLLKTKVKFLSTCFNSTIKLTRKISKGGVINHYSVKLKSKHENWTEIKETFLPKAEECLLISL